MVNCVRAESALKGDEGDSWPKIIYGQSMERAGELQKVSSPWPYLLPGIGRDGSHWVWTAISFGASRGQSTRRSLVKAVPVGRRGIGRNDGPAARRMMARGGGVAGVPSGPDGRGEWRRSRTRSEDPC